MLILVVDKSIDHQSQRKSSFSERKLKKALCDTFREQHDIWTLITMAHCGET